jgi:hypothetical protein
MADFRSPKIRRLIVVFFSTLGIVVFSIGIGDLVASAGLGSRLVGASLATSGVVLLLAARSLLSIKGVDKELFETAIVQMGRTNALIIPLSGGIIGFFVGLLFLRAIWLNFETGFRMMLTVVLSAGVLIASVYISILVLRASRGIHLSVLGGRLVGSLGASVALLFSIFQFWWGANYLPSSLPTDVIITPTLSHLTTREDGVTSVQVSIAIRNAGKKKLTIVASIYKLVGHKITMDPKKRPTFDDYQQTFLQKSVTSRHAAYSVYSRPTVIEFGRFLSAGNFLEPDQEKASTLIAHLPPKVEFKMLSLVAEVWFVGADKGISVESSVQPRLVNLRNKSCAVVEEWPIRRSSLFNVITSAPQEIAVTFLLTRPSEKSCADQSLLDTPSLSVSILPRGFYSRAEPTNPYPLAKRNKLLATYGLMLIGQGTQLSWDSVRVQKQSTAQRPS